MHFYSFNIADYRKDTRHLSQTEHYIYRELLDEYYLSEVPLPLDEKKLVRKLLLNSNQAETLHQILNEFFVLEDDGYHNRKADIVMGKVYEKSEKARASANAKWASLKQSRESTNKINRAQRLSAAREKGSHTKSEWEGMKVFFNHTCVECHGANGLNGVVKDHITPIYQGGSDSINNIQPLCAKCNSSKGAESTDHRIAFYKANACEMPANWEKVTAKCILPITQDPLPKTNGKNNPTVGQKPDNIDEIFSFWKETFKHPKASLDDKRKATIRKALKSHSVGKLKLAITGCSRDDWHMGKNDRGKVYDQVHVIFKDADKIEGFIDSKPPPATYSEFPE